MKVRVHELAKEARVSSKRVTGTLRLLGYKVGSPSTALELQPIERDALVETIRKRTVL